MAEKIQSKQFKSEVKEALKVLHAGAESGKKVTNQDAEFAIKAVAQVIGDTLRSGKNAGLTGVGTIELRPRAERAGRNPQTGEAITIEARTGLGFNPSEGLRLDVKNLQV